jgi:hypothetical protein
MKNIIAKFSAAIIFLAIFSCKTSELGYPILTVNGMIYDFNNKAIPNCTVQIGEKHFAVSDINGRFYVPKIPSGNYSIIIIKEEHEVFHDKIIVEDNTQIVYIRIPSITQLLELADNALEKNQIQEAASFVDRAKSIGKRTTELLYYAAIVSFRQQDYSTAQELLIEAKQQGANDSYIDIFLKDLNQLLDDENEIEK